MTTLSDSLVFHDREAIDHSCVDRSRGLRDAGFGATAMTSC